jgi:hypothetical protein
MMLSNSYPSQKSAPLEPVRLLGEGDIPWLLDLGRRRYSVEFDAHCTEAWFKNIVLKSPLIFFAMRTDKAFMICNLIKDAWLPGVMICNNMMLNSEAGAVWEEVALVREAIEWARKRRCAEFRIWSDTEVDLQAIAVRVGAMPSAVRYTVRL